MAGIADVTPPVDAVSAPLASAEMWLVDTRDRPWLTPARTTLLDRNECRRAEAFLSEALTQRYVATWCAVRALLGRRLGVAPAEVPISRTCGVCGAAEHGRPVIGLPDGSRDLHLGVARTDRRALVAIAATPVGVDLEERGRAERDGAAVWAVALADRERAAVSAIASPSERRHAVLRAWVRKEAVLKAAGDGLLAPPRSVPVLDEPTPQVGGRRYGVADVAVQDGVAAISWCL